MTAPDENSENHKEVEQTITDPSSSEPAWLETDATAAENMDAVYNLSFDEILRTCSRDEFAVDVRKYFSERLAFFSEAKTACATRDNFRKRILYKAKIEVLDLMQSDEIQKMICADTSQNTKTELLLDESDGDEEDVSGG